MPQGISIPEHKDCNDFADYCAGIGAAHHSMIERDLEILSWIDSTGTAQNRLLAVCKKCLSDENLEGTPQKGITKHQLGQRLNITKLTTHLQHVYDHVPENKNE